MSNGNGASPDNPVSESGGGGLTQAQEAAMVGQVVEVGGGIAIEILRIIGNKVEADDGQQYDLAQIIQLMNAQNAAKPPAAVVAPKPDWVPWVVGGGLALALLFMLGRR